MSDDAYGEFAKASYTNLKEFKSQIDRAALLARIDQPETKPHHRRLYLTMLGVCGSSADLPHLERLIQNRDQDVRLCLDAAIACYLTLRRPRWPAADGGTVPQESGRDSP